ncbi:MAG: hypothetical protein ACFFDH_04385 [Promethearchaeota archaeon]
MKQVKGSMAVTIMKNIKTSPKGLGPYNQILSDKAKDLLNRRILTGSWYPYDAYRECFDALCAIEARNDPKTLTEWGLNESKVWLSTVYQSTIDKGNLQALTTQYTRFHRLVFNFGEIQAKFISDTEIEFTYVDLPLDWANYYYMALGWVISFVETTINKKVDYVFLNKSWEGKGWTKIKLSWSS